MHFIKEFKFFRWWMKIQGFLFWIFFVAIVSASCLVWYMYIYNVRKDGLKVQNTENKQKNVAFEEGAFKQIIDVVTRRKEKYEAEFSPEKDIFRR